MSSGVERISGREAPSGCGYTSQSGKHPRKRYPPQKRQHFRKQTQKPGHFPAAGQKLLKENDMTLEETIQQAIKEAMKAKDMVAMNATRAIKSEILLFKTSEGGSKEVIDGDILKMIQKLVKQRREAADQYAAANRQELADNELSEAAVMEKFLPKQLSAEEVKTRIREIIAQTGAASIKDMGKVMAAANKALAGLSDGRTISGIVKELLG